MTIEQIKELIASVDNDSADHCLWIDTKGVVHLDALPCEFKDLKKKIREYEKGDGWCGEVASGYYLYMKVLYIDILNIQKEINT